MEMHRTFALQKFLRNIETCRNVEELQDTAVKIMQLYLRQQDTINEMVKKGWLPDEAAN
jgi:hypothetical protein